VSIISVAIEGATPFSAITERSDGQANPAESAQHFLRLTRAAAPTAVLEAAGAGATR
jgi:hypothetical protein